MLWTALLLACGSAPDAAPAQVTHPIEGTVIELRGADVVVIDHAPIDGFMDAMMMPFTVADPGLLDGVDPGEEVAGTYVVGPERSFLSELRVTKALAPEPPSHHTPPPRRVEPVPVGETFPSTPVKLAHGGTLTLGEGQDSGGPVALTFIYTRCPVPEYCPKIVGRFQALQEQLPEGARLLAITMDPDYDNAGVLRAFGKEAAAVPGSWDFGWLPKEVLVGVAETSGLAVHGRGLGISHDLVLVVLDSEGRVKARYDHFDWPLQELVDLLSS